VRRWKGHVGEYVRLGLIHERGELRQLGAQLVGDPAPLCARRFGIILREGRGDESRDDAPALSAGMRQHGQRCQVAWSTLLAALMPSCASEITSLSGCP
jgi:hypothetical protein